MASEPGGPSTTADDFAIHKLFSDREAHKIERLLALITVSFIGQAVPAAMWVGFYTAKLPPIMLHLAEGIGIAIAFVLGMSVESTRKQIDYARHHYRNSTDIHSPIAKYLLGDEIDATRFLVITKIPTIKIIFWIVVASFSSGLLAH